jgi:MraZ protein
MGGNGFTSTYFGSLDAKGRVCVPAVFREFLDEQHTKGVYVFRPSDTHVLEGFGLELYDFMQVRYANNDPFYDEDEGDDGDKLADFNAHTQLLPLDDNGRVRLPDELIRHAHLADKVAFVGLGRKFRICTPEQFKADDDARTERIQMRARAKRAARMRKLREGVDRSDEVEP